MSRTIAEQLADEIRARGIGPINGGNQGVILSSEIMSEFLAAHPPVPRTEVKLSPSLGVTVVNMGGRSVAALNHYDAAVLIKQLQEALGCNSQK